jgi:tRNA (guanine-N7-)-methyltransferase
MGKDKLRRFAEFSSFENCFDFPRHLKGKWHSDYFKNNNPIVLELGCGKGEYTVALSEAFPEKNFIGIDLKSNRMWVGAKKAIESDRKNVAFIRMVIFIKVHGIKTNFILIARKNLSIEMGLEFYNKF